MQRRRLAAALEAGNGASALDALRLLASAGAVLSPAAEEQARSLVGDDAIAPLTLVFRANAVPIARSRPFAEVSLRHRLIEGIEWLPDSRSLLASSVVGGEIAIVGGDGAPIVLPAGGPLGMAYDRDRHLLWVASSDLELRLPERARFAGLYALERPTPWRVRQVAAPPGTSPGDVEVARDGTVYASDGLSGAVYRCLPGCTALESWLPPGTFYSAQGLAVSRDQRLLYVADRRYGLAAVKRTTGVVFRVEAPPGTMLDGIDGLVGWRGDLIATQTAYPPQRIVRLRLTRGGLRVSRLDILERAHPDWGEVTLATVAGNRLLYVADAQWDRWGPGGAPAGARAPAATPIRSLPLD